MVPDEYANPVHNSPYENNTANIELNFATEAAAAQMPKVSDQVQQTVTVMLEYSLRPRKK